METLDKTKFSKRLSNVVEVENLIVSPSSRFRMDIADNEYARRMVIDALTKTYEDPAGASARELVFNAIDACNAVGGGTVEVTLPTDLEPTLVVKDNGEGMSRERLETAYVKYANSSKLDDLSQVGAKGLGAKAPLSFLPAFNVTTARDGVEIQVRVSKEETGNYMNIIKVTEGVDWTGTEVTLPNIPHCEMKSIVEAVDKFTTAFMPNIKLVVYDVEKNPLGFHFVLDDAEMFFPQNSGRGVLERVSTYLRNPSNTISSWVYGGYKYTYVGEYQWRNTSLMLVDLPLGSVTFPPSRDVIQNTPDNRKVLDILASNVENGIGTAFLDAFKEWLMQNPGLWIPDLSKMNANCVMCNRDIDGGLVLSFAKQVSYHSPSFSLGYKIVFTKAEMDKMEQDSGLPVMNLIAPQVNFADFRLGATTGAKSNLKYNGQGRNYAVDSLRENWDTIPSHLTPSGKYVVLQNVDPAKVASAFTWLNKRFQKGELSVINVPGGVTAVFAPDDAKEITEAMDAFKISYTTCDTTKIKVERGAKKEVPPTLAIGRAYMVDFADYQEFLDAKENLEVPYSGNEYMLEKDDMDGVMIAIASDYYTFDTATVLNAWSLWKSGVLKNSRFLLLNGSRRGRYETKCPTASAVANWATKHGAELVYWDGKPDKSTVDLRSNSSRAEAIRMSVEDLPENASNAVLSLVYTMVRTHAPIDADVLQGFLNDHASDSRSFFEALRWGVSHKGELEELVRYASLSGKNNTVYRLEDIIRVIVLVDDKSVQRQLLDGIAEVLGGIE